MKTFFGNAFDSSKQNRAREYSAFVDTVKQGHGFTGHVD